MKSHFFLSIVIINDVQKYKKMTFYIIIHMMVNYTKIKNLNGKICKYWKLGDKIHEKETLVVKFIKLWKLSNKI